MSNVIHTKAVDAVEAKPERWTSGPYEVRRFIDSSHDDHYELRGFDGTTHAARIPQIVELLTAILSPPPAASEPAPVASEDPRRVVGAVVGAESDTIETPDEGLLIVVASDPNSCQRYLDGRADNGDGLAEEYPDDKFIRWATRDECARHGLVYVDRSKPVASEARATTCPRCASDHASKRYMVHPTFVEQVAAANHGVSSPPPYSCDHGWHTAPTPAATTAEEDRKRERDERIALELLDKAAFDLGVAVETMRSTLAARKERGA